MAVASPDHRGAPSRPRIAPIPRVNTVARLCLLLCCLLAFGGCWSIPPGILAAQELKNFDRINAQLFRGAQPDSEGIAQLARIGVRTVIDLRMSGEGPAEEASVRAAGMNYRSMPLRGFGAPTAAQMEEILALIDQSLSPVFIHCRRGADRTGTVIACYRIRRDRWTSEQALREAEAHGMAWVQFGMKNFIRRFPSPIP